MTYFCRSLDDSTRSLVLILYAAIATSLGACGSDLDGASEGAGSNPATFTDGTATGGTSAGPLTTGGTTLASSGGTASVGAGGAPTVGSGGGPPIDCTPISNAGFEVCEASADTCAVVFYESEGCTAVCASAGLSCLSAAENVEAMCAADLTLPGLPCDSGHQSDFCLCGGSGAGAGTGGSATGGTTSTGGAIGTGGSGAGVSEPDCNQNTEQAVIRVAKDGSGNHSTVQAAIDSLPGSNSTPTIIRIAPGTYYEKLVVDVPNITLCGQLGQESNTLLTYSDGADTNGVGTTGSASVNMSSDDVSVENITFENTRGVGSQAVALLVSGKRVQFLNSRFIGKQDTLYVRGGPLYFRDCYVEGTVDFIFGDATAVFDECTIHNVGGGSAVTAPSTDQATPYGIVFLGGKLTAAAGVSNSSVNLGRNWRPYGSTTYVEVELGAHIAAGGWIPMGDNSLSTARFSEFQSTGPGANAGGRTSESRQLNAVEAATFTVENMLTPWAPSFSP